MLTRRHITICVARQDVVSHQGLSHRWVEERTLAWMELLRRQTVRQDIHAASLSLDLTCFRTAQWFFQELYEPDS